MPTPQVITDPAVMEGYLTDASNTRGNAEALVRPRTIDEVSETVAWCQQQGIPLTVTARRTGTTGAAVPAGGWLLALDHFEKVHALDHVDAGVLLGEHQDRVAAAGLFFPPDPTSRYDCSIGGAISCNASGARSFRYGATRPWIEEVEAVLATGEVVRANRSTPVPSHWPAPVWSPPSVKTAAGYEPTHNLLDLLIGQEGTLAVITSARLRLIPAPQAVMSMFAFFPDPDSLLAFVNSARRHATRARGPQGDGPLQPRALEYFDHNSLRLARAHAPDIPAHAHGAILVEVEHDGSPPYEAWFAALEEHGALVDDTIIAEDETGIRRLQQIRHAIPAGINEQVVRNRMPKVGTDFAVPDAALPTMMDAYAAVTLPNACFGHIGDNHLHLNFLPTSKQELEAARAAYVTLAREAVSLGGTVSAEHGIGKLKRGLLAEMVGPEVLASFQALKAAADPAWVLGRGTLVALPAHRFS